MTLHSLHLAGFNRRNKENSNEETWGHAGNCFYFPGAALIASCAKPLPEEVERYVFGLQILTCVLEGGAGGILGCGEDARRKGETHRSDDVRPSAEVGMFRTGRGTAAPPESASPRRVRRFSARRLTKAVRRHPGDLRGCGCAGFKGACCTSERTTSGRPREPERMAALIPGKGPLRSSRFRDSITRRSISRHG